MLFKFHSCYRGVGPVTMINYSYLFVYGSDRTLVRNTFSFSDGRRLMCNGTNLSFMCKTNLFLKTFLVIVVSVRPTGMSLTGLDQWVKENTQVEVVCKVDRVKPQASLYWRKGDRGRLTKTTPVVTDSGGVFQLVSTFTVSFMKTDHNTKLYCLVTRPGDSGTVWATVNETVKVSCEYIILITIYFFVSHSASKYIREFRCDFTKDSGIDLSRSGLLKVIYPCCIYLTKIVLLKLQRQ